MAADAERQIEALAAEAGALRELRTQRRSALREVTGARLRLEKTFGEFRHTGGAADPKTRAASASALGVARWLLTLLIGGTVCWGIWALALAARGIAAPAKHLAEIARAIIQGNSKRRANVKLSGEFHLLAEALNEMIDARLQAEDRLRLANESLELKVSARTAELWKANRALREESEQRARAEREFQQAQKMDALGKLAGSYPVAAGAAVTPTEAFPSPAADAVMVEWLPALVCAAATVTCCGSFQFAGVKVSAWPLDTLVPVPASLRCTVIGLLGAVDSLTANDALCPFAIVSEDWASSRWDSRPGRPPGSR